MAILLPPCQPYVALYRHTSKRPSFGLFGSSPSVPFFAERKGFRFHGLQASMPHQLTPRNYSPFFAICGIDSAVRFVGFESKVWLLVQCGHMPRFFS